ncbi:acetyltransferase [Alkalihalobacillus hwajinpoensis]|uniref:acetyltransferase n=1 Tax=Guptibacillus hwajinpoensis TaxID=208199 RepID=UPI00188339E4|nr:acetyltransferase [Pseudalkalibacillus hwajinpoensis]MBF0705392.1 acetyltransferase [Pseudalkalibacillus hwajinpoensis]
MDNIVIFGSGGHSKVVIDIVEKEGRYNIVGLVDPFQPIGKEVLGYEVIGDLQDLIEMNETVLGGIVAMGDNWKRYETVKRIQELLPTFYFVKAIHPSAQIGKNVTIGNGTVVMANTVINSHTSIRDHCIINTKSSIDHDGCLHNFVTIAPGATLAGSVSIGDHSVISIGATVIHNRNIGRHTVIGAGSTVLHDIDSYVVAYGTPAKSIRERKEGEPYL